MTGAEGLMQVRVKRISYEAESINSYDLVATAGGDLAAFTAGSHIDLHLPNGMIRSYSLVNDQSERRRYVIAINKDAASRGGSRSIHETVRPGDLVTISHPRNNFVLQESASHTVLIAGGIGITPLLPMARAAADMPACFWSAMVMPGPPGRGASGLVWWSGSAGSPP